MIVILNESLQDVDNYLKSSELKDSILEEFPEIKNDPESVDYEVSDFVVSQISSRFPDDRPPEVVNVEVLKVAGDETEVISTDHSVVNFNGSFYDFTAHQFSDSYSKLLSYVNVPVTQKVITNDLQINDGVSSVKSYALLEV